MQQNSECQKCPLGSDGEVERPRAVSQLVSASESRASQGVCVDLVLPPLDEVLIESRGGRQK